MKCKLALGSKFWGQTPYVCMRDCHLTSFPYGKTEIICRGPCTNVTLRTPYYFQ